MALTVRSVGGEDPDGELSALKKWSRASGAIGNYSARGVVRGRGVLVSIRAATFTYGRVDQAGDRSSGFYSSSVPSDPPIKRWLRCAPSGTRALRRTALVLQVCRKSPAHGSSGPPKRRLPTAGRALDRGDTVAAMGFVKQGLAARSFLVVVACLCEGDREGESCFVPAEGVPGRALGFQGAQSPVEPLGWSFFPERFLFFLPGQVFFTPRQLLSQPSEKEWRRLHNDLIGSGRGTVPSITEPGFWDSATVARVRRSKAFLKGLD